MRAFPHGAAALVAALCTASVSNPASALDYWQWYTDTNRDGTTDDTFQFGRTTDKFLPADFDGDGSTDPAAIRIVAGKLQWFIDLDHDGSSETSPTFGNSGDSPHAADYDDDGAADLAVIRKDSGNLRWFVDTNGDGTKDIDKVFGVDTDTPYPGDYNGDGRADFAVVRKVGNSLRWYIDTNRDGTSNLVINYGFDGDRPVPADYNGDGSADFAVVRNVSGSWKWFVDTNRDGSGDISATFGLVTDVTRPADYNGDGSADFAVLRREDAHWTWFIDSNRNGTTDSTDVYGLTSDYPFPADFNGSGAADYAVIRRDWSDMEFRIPFSDGTSVSIANNVVGHSPLGRIDMSRTGATPGNVVAAAAGEVVAIVDWETETCDTCQNNYIWIRHDNGEYTKYSHIREDSAFVVVGSLVEAGEFLGIEDDVGQASGVHLHFEVGVPFDETDPFDSGGYLKGYNRVPRICDIEGGTFVENESYVAAPCD